MPSSVSGYDQTKDLAYLNLGPGVLRVDHMDDVHPESPVGEGSDAGVHVRVENLRNV